MKRASPASLSVLPAFSTSIFMVSSAPLRQASSASSSSGPELLEEVDQVAVVADAGLEEAVVHVVFEVDGFAIGRVFIAGAMQVGHALDVLGENGGQADRNRVGLERRQRVVADVKIPQGIQNALAAERSAFAQHLGQHLRLVARHRFIAGIDAVLVLVLRAGPDPRGEIAGVLVEQVVDALLAVRAGPSRPVPCSGAWRALPACRGAPRVCRPASSTSATLRPRPQSEPTGPGSLRSLSSAASSCGSSVRSRKC